MFTSGRWAHYMTFAYDEDIDLYFHPWLRPWIVYVFLPSGGYPKLLCSQSDLVQSYVGVCKSYVGDTWVQLKRYYVPGRR